MNRRFETEQYEAFEALTKALESLDRYQESQSAADLEEAENRVNEALGFDSSYLKAIYFKGITGYLNDKPLTAWNLFSSVLREAKAVNEASSPLLTEIRYNLAATTLEHARGNESLLGLAISLFQEVIDSVPSDDLVLELLSRAGAARAYAERSLTAGSEQVNEDRMTAREHCDYVEQALRQQENFLSRIIRRKRIQKDVATQIREIVRVTKDKIAESEREKSPESPSQPTSVQTETAASAPEPEVAESPEAHPATERSGTDENPEARIEARPTWLERRHPLSGDLHSVAEFDSVHDTEAKSESDFIANESVLEELGAALERQRELTPDEIIQLLTDDELAAERVSVRRRLRGKRRERSLNYGLHRAGDISGLSSEAKAEATAPDSAETAPDQTTENAE